MYSREFRNYTKVYVLVLFIIYTARASDPSNTSINNFIYNKDTTINERDESALKSKIFTTTLGNEEQFGISPSAKKRENFNLGTRTGPSPSNSINTSNIATTSTSTRTMAMTSESVISAAPNQSTSHSTGILTESPSSSATPSLSFLSQSNFNKNSLLHKQSVSHQHIFSIYAENGHAANVPVARPTRNNRANSNKVQATELEALNSKNVNSNSYAATYDVHYEFYDKINGSNQWNEFNGSDETATASTKSPSASSSGTTSISSIGTQREIPLSQQKSFASSTEAAITTASSSSSSYFERVELQESLSQDQRSKWLLHREKRYLIFPEGSSFQMVFDLIIGGVDYSSFIILGITCAVAWELPSKPPSEIIEDFKEKINDATLLLNRRNDTVDANTKYINKDPMSGIDRNYEQVQRPTATIGSTDQRFFGWPALPSNSYAPLPIAAVTTHYYAPPLSPHQPYIPPLQSSSTPTHHYYSSNYNDWSDKSQRKRPFSSGKVKYYDNPMGKYSEETGVDWTPNYRTKNRYDSYGPISGSYAYADKRKFANDRHWHHFTHSPDAAYAGNRGYYEDAQGYNKYQKLQGQSHPYKSKWANDYAGNGWQKDNNWWQKNSQRIRNSWTNQREYDWNRSGRYMRNVVWDEGGTSHYVHGTQRKGRQRKILKAPPKHRIYPVFGKRRRRRDAEVAMEQQESSDIIFDLKWERIHLREHLRTRHKLYKKIEKLYKIRGHNGTACVLRALCETGQRQHHNDADEETEEEPQTFITELLRAIFVLPRNMQFSTNTKNNANHRGRRSNTAATHEKYKLFDAMLTEELHEHIPFQYREAHDHPGNCSQRYPECGHSIW